MKFYLLVYIILKTNSHNFLQIIKRQVHVKSMAYVVYEIKTEFLRLIPGFRYFDFTRVRSILKEVHAFTHKMVNLSATGHKQVNPSNSL